MIPGRRLQYHLLLLVCLWQTSTALAQERTVSLGVGNFSAYQLINYYNSVEANLPVFDKYRFNNVTSNGLLFGSYQITHRKKQRSQWRFDLGYQRTNQEVLDSPFNRAVNTVRTDYITAMAGMNFFYAQARKFKIYGGVSLGYSLAYQRFDFRKENIERIVWHITPIGFETGKKWMAFAELGLGTRGAILAGVKYRFKDRKPDPLKDWPLPPRYYKAKKKGKPDAENKAIDSSKTTFSVVGSEPQIIDNKTNKGAFLPAKPSPKPKFPEKNKNKTQPTKTTVAAQPQKAALDSASNRQKKKSILPAKPEPKPKFPEKQKNSSNNANAVVVAQLPKATADSAANNPKKKTFLPAKTTPKPKFPNKKTKN